MNLSSRLPWQAKFVIEIILARLPFDYRTWQYLGLFTQDDMANIDDAIGVFNKHYERVDFARKGRDFVMLELGPGDSLFSAIIARAHGAATSYLVDTGEYASAEIEAYRALLQKLRASGFDLPAYENLQTAREILTACNSHYLCDGLASLRGIPNNSVDFIWSNSMLEHIRLHEFLAFNRECRRILKADGICSHCIDLKDHLDGGLNNLRFPYSVWESAFMAKSGFYTNRIQYSEMLELFEIAGFEPKVVDIQRWPVLPTPPKRFSRDFKDCAEEDFKVSEFDVLLKPKPRQ